MDSSFFDEKHYILCKMEDKSDIATKYRECKNEIKTTVWVAEIAGILYNNREYRT